MQQTAFALTIIGGDTRYTHAARFLQKSGWHADTFQVQGSPDTVSRHALFRNRILLLPYPAFNARGFIPFLQGESILSVQELLPHCSADTTIFCGRPGSYLADLQATGATVIDYEQDEFLTAANAVLTAEGALELAMRQMEHTLWRSACLVIGFGRVGKQVSRSLHRLGAQVTVAARKPADLAPIHTLGMQADRTAHYEHPLTAYRLIINTVPAPIFTPQHYDAIAPDCTLIDLASSPGGIDASQCLKRQLSFWHARGLPGKTAPVTAGQLIAETVIRNLSGKETL